MRLSGTFHPGNWNQKGGISSQRKAHRTEIVPDDMRAVQDQIVDAMKACFASMKDPVQSRSARSTLHEKDRAAIRALHNALSEVDGDCSLPSIICLLAYYEVSQLQDHR